MKKRKRTGPNTEPWGTPYRSLKDRDSAPPKETRARRSERNDWVQRTKQGGKPAARSLEKRAGCQTESKAREKSTVANTVRRAGFGL